MVFFSKNREKAYTITITLIIDKRGAAMSVSKHKNNHHHSDYDLHGDIAKLKAALREASLDVKGRATELISDSFEGVKDKSKAAKDSMANYTAERPFKSLGIALVVGIAIGYLFRK